MTSPDTSGDTTPVVGGEDPRVEILTEALEGARSLYAGRKHSERFARDLLARLDAAGPDPTEAAVRAVFQERGFRATSTPLVKFVEESLGHLGAMTMDDRVENDRMRAEDERRAPSWLPAAQVVSGAIPRRDWPVAVNVALALETAGMIPADAAVPASGGDEQVGVDDAQNLARDALREGAWTLPRNADAAASDVLASFAARGVRLVWATARGAQPTDQRAALVEAFKTADVCWEPYANGGRRGWYRATPAEAERMADVALRTLGLVEDGG